MTHGTMAKSGISVRWWFLGVNLLILLMPILAFFSLRLYRSQVIRQTEIKLIAESVLIGEAFRERLMEVPGVPAALTPDIRPWDAKDDHYFPITPLLDEDSVPQPRILDPLRHATDRSGPEWSAGQKLAPLLGRARVFNLSSARVLNRDGCVVAASGTWLGACLDHIPEVQAALAGRYAAATRERLSDEPKPDWSSISRRGDLRVFTATPVFSDGRVIGVVWMSRTGMDPLKAAWLSRRPLMTTLMFSVLLVILVSLYLSWRITKPLRRLTASAEAIARGQSRAPVVPVGPAPREVRTLGTALATMTRQLSDRAAYIADFAANVGHELKSPITSIQGAAELIREEGPDMPPGQREKFLLNIEADAGRMERLVNRLLELARIQSSPEASRTIEVPAFLDRIAESYAEAVSLDASRAPKRIVIHPDHLESAVRNLLDNAVRHGAGQPVDLVARSDDQGLIIEVRDRGPGISDANQDRIFDRFFTTERDRGGTGLGLAIVKAVAETRGGRISCRSSPDGTVFILTV